MAELLQIPCEATLTAAEVECPPPRRWQQFEQVRSAEVPVEVVVGSARPPRPVLRLRLPRVPQAHVESIVGLARLTLPDQRWELAEEARGYVVSASGTLAFRWRIQLAEEAAARPDR